MLLLPLVFGGWKPSEGLQWLPEFSRFGASERASGALPVPIPALVRMGWAGFPGQLLRDPRDAPTSILLLLCSCPRRAGAGWWIHQHLPSVKREREQGKLPVNDLCREEIYTVCAIFHLPLFFSSASPVTNAGFQQGWNIHGCLLIPAAAAGSGQPFSSFQHPAAALIPIL